MTKIKKLIPGIVFVLVISIVSIIINSILESYIRLEALTIAIIIGIIYNNLIGTQGIFKEGIAFSLKKLLKAGIVLLGFKLSIYSLLNLGPKVIILVVLYVSLLLIFSVILGKMFNVDLKLATLIGIGSSICGASAVVALAPCINADEEDSVVAVSIVSLLGAIGVLIYSSIATSNVEISPTQYGIWSGLSLHGVAHAIAAAFAKGSTSGEIGTFVKMSRVAMIVPVSLVLSYIFNNKDKNNKTVVKFPMYVLYFILAGLINSSGIIPQNFTTLLSQASSLLILMAMTAMGLSVSFRSIITKGIKGIMVGSTVFLIFSIISLFVILNIV